MRDPKLVAIQRDIEHLFDKNQAIECIKEEFLTRSNGKLPEFLEANGVIPSLGIALLVQMELHRRTDPKTLFGILRNHVDEPEQLGPQVIKCIQLGLVHYDDEAHFGKGQFIVAHEISEELRTRIERFQYPLPMVVEPLRIIDNKDTGYFTGQRSIMLNNNHTEEDVCLDHINRMNAIRLTINHRTVHKTVNTWKNLNGPKEGETDAEHKKRLRAFEKYDRVSRWIIDCLSKVTDVLYVTYRYDKRGRTYAQGYHVNPQGASWNKAMIEFADKEFIQ